MRVHMLQVHWHTWLGLQYQYQDSTSTWRSNEKKKPGARRPGPCPAGYAGDATDHDGGCRAACGAIRGGGPARAGGQWFCRAAAAAAAESRVTVSGRRGSGRSCCPPPGGLPRYSGRFIGIIQVRRAAPARLQCRWWPRRRAAAADAQLSNGPGPRPGRTPGPGLRLGLRVTGRRRGGGPT